jgi:hypothetical protein
MVVFPAAKLLAGMPTVLLLSHWVETATTPVGINLLVTKLQLNLPTVNFDLNLLAFPTLLLLSLASAVVGSLATKAEADDVLVSFYTRTRPWGWWGPIKQAAVHRDPTFRPNRDFFRDACNVLIGIVWQTSFVALPIYVVIKSWHEAGICIAIIAVTSAILKFSWYDRLQYT